MRNILILTSSNNPLYRQISKNGMPVKEKYIFEINTFTSEFEQNIDKFDFLVVLDDYKESIELNYPKDRMILFTGEPPYIKIYPTKYLDQFGSIFTCQKAILKRSNAYSTIPPLPWMTGCSLKENSHMFSNTKHMNYDDFSSYSNLDRLDKVCIITSNKKITKGHRDRVDFALKLKHALPDKVDIFGNGFTNISDKFTIQSKYKYSIVIENCSYPNYWTEKLADTYLAGSFPIYYGAPNIGDYFSDNEIKIININNFQYALNLIKEILGSSLYHDSISSLNEAKLKVLNQYNTFSIIISCIDKIKHPESKTMLSNFNPIHFSILDSVKQKIIRLMYP
ncbi:glycosyltransferase family 10 [Paludibacter sp.]|uniref:glycosyltransferase family 10 domain-containing protein n=1 Tax=Paludibacter sp. TaxID=1898105 RepID=UPI00135325C1|nr:glycosyltransferase family 10 [Paludibacter sp.]MTK52802.1 transferase [Paludibacter sp.]